MSSLAALGPRSPARPSPGQHESAASFDAIGQFQFLLERIRLLEAVVSNFPGGISVYDSDLRMVLCNEQQKQLLEYTDELFADGYPTLEDVFRFNALRGEYGPGDPEALVQLYIERARQAQPHSFERTRPNGTVLEIHGVPLRDGGFVTTYIDVTERRKAQATIAHMAHHDALTGLPNRALFHDRLDQALARVQRGERIAVVYADLDGFKPVNDRHGHAIGDALLKCVAGRLDDTTRATDTVARLGGDEFAVIQASIAGPADAKLLADRLLDRLSAPYDIDTYRLNVGVSMGIALAPEHGDDPDRLVRCADDALYRSKFGGRGTYTFYGPG